MSGWVEFRRPDPCLVVDMVRAVAGAADAGEYGQGVEVVIEAPGPGRLRRVLSALLLRRRRTPEQARIAVTKAGGDLRYPFHVQLISAHGGRAAHLVPRVSGWASSNSAGLAFLVQKGSPGAAYDWDALVAGAIGALSALRPDAGDRGWRASTDRAVRRS